MWHPVHTACSYLVPSLSPDMTCVSFQMSEQHAAHAVVTWYLQVLSDKKETSRKSAEVIVIYHSM